MFSSYINRLLEEKSNYKNDFSKLEIEILRLISVDNVYSILEPFIKNRGKRLRSLLYFKNWTGDYSNTDVKYKTIALLELLHLASILHDDVVDNNNIRRGYPSFMKKYGKKKSILLGDLILIKTINELLEMHKKSKTVRDLCMKSCISTAYGAVLEQDLSINSRFQDYIKVASLKTSPFFKLACFLGKFLSTNDPFQSQQAAIEGLYFGIVFQIQNDLDGYKFESFKQSEDFMQKNITFPILVLRDHLGYDISKFLTSNQERYIEIRELIASREFQQRSKELIQKFFNKKFNFEKIVR